MHKSCLSHLTMLLFAGCFNAHQRRNYSIDQPRRVQRLLLHQWPLQSFKLRSQPVAVTALHTDTHKHDRIGQACITLFYFLVSFYLYSTVNDDLYKGNSHFIYICNCFNLFIAVKLSIAIADRALFRFSLDAPNSHNHMIETFCLLLAPHSQTRTRQLYKSQARLVPVFLSRHFSARHSLSFDTTHMYLFSHSIQFYC